MKSFADWTQEIAEANNHEPEPEKAEVHVFDMGVEDVGQFSYAWIGSDGKWLYECSCCNRCFIMSDHFDISEYDDDNRYCGGSPQCCP